MSVEVFSAAEIGDLKNNAPQGEILVFEPVCSDSGGSVQFDGYDH